LPQASSFGQPTCSTAHPSTFASTSPDVGRTNPTTTRVSRMSSQLSPAPLITLGPGGSYNTAFIPRGSRLLAVSPAAPLPDHPQARSETHRDAAGHSSFHQPRASAAPSPARPATLLDRLLGIDRVEISEPARLAGAAAAESHRLNAQAQARAPLAGAPPRRPSPPGPARSPRPGHPVARPRPRTASPVLPTGACP
jgi:hypothetical protein